MCSSPDPETALRTTTTLLDGLHDHANEVAWGLIDQRYRPVVSGFARRFGVGANEADEIAQRTLAEFVSAYRAGRYDRTKGRLSSWILGIAHHTILHTFRDGQRAAQIGAGELADLSDESMMHSIWIDERDRQIFAQAMAILRRESAQDERTMEAFELAALRGVPPIEVARRCRMSVEQVYVAKNRVTRKLRDLVRDITAAFEDDH